MNQLSTGPVTIAGKQTSSRNATKHGCCSTNTLILAHEKIEDFEALEATWFQSYAPKDDAESYLVHQLVTAEWLLQRATRTVADVEARISTAVPDPLAWDESHHRTLARFLRYQAAHANTVRKHRQAIEDYRKNRISENHKEERLTISKARLTIHQEKNKPKRTFEEALQITRERAIRLGYRQPDSPQS